MQDFNYKYWIIELNEGIIKVKINRPAKMNAFNTPMMEELLSILTMIKNDTSLKVMILTTVSEDFFCTGADIESFAALTGEEAFIVSQESHKLFGMLEELPIPVVTLVKGMCFTAGFELTLCSDLIYAAENALFGQLETQYGITPGGVELKD